MTSALNSLPEEAGLKKSSSNNLAVFCTNIYIYIYNYMHIIYCMYIKNGDGPGNSE